MKYFVSRGEDRRLDASSRTSLRGSFAGLSDGVTHYELAGPADGAVVVLIGGLTVPLSYWDATASGLHQRGLRTLAYSGYGRGYSDRVRARYDERLFVRQLAELVGTLGVAQPVHLAGTSLGALIAMAYAGSHAAAVATLTLAGPAGLAPATAFSPHRMLRSDVVAGFVGRRFGRRLLDGHLGHNVRDPGQAAQLARMVLDSYRYEGSLYAFFDTLQHFPFSGRAELFRRTGQAGLPVMLLWGADDQVTPIASLSTAQALLRPAQCHVIPGCGHMAPFERPDDVAAKIASFTASRTGRPGS